MALAPAPTGMDADDEGAGGGPRNQGSMVVAKSEAVCTKAGPPVVDPEPVENEGGAGDTTECSSSFGDTCSGFQGAAGDGEPEVISGMPARSDGGRPWKPPRKKVTAEWRNSVRPILWRCQWLELSMKELSSQVLKYDWELALIKKQKELQAASKANGPLSESMQIHHGHGNSIMKRRKRKRHEENLDTPLYINKHQILSYYHVFADKQNKRAETNSLLIDDECGSTVPIPGELDSVTLLDSENYDVIFEQLFLRDILLMIDGVQSRVHLLQDSLRKAHSEGRTLAFSEGNTHVSVAHKRQHTQKRSSYTEHRYTKPLKKKNINILLKDDNRPALSGRPLPDRETGTHIKDANWTAEERSKEGNIMDLLLGIGNIPNGYIEDLCRENADYILIDNQATNDVCQQLDKAKHLPSGTSKEQNISVLVEVKNTCAPVEVDTTCVLAVGKGSSVEKSPSKDPVSSGSKQELNSQKKRRKKCSLFSRKKQRKEASKTPASREKAEDTPSVANTQTESTPSAAKQKTDGTCSAATGPRTMAARSAGKKWRSVNEPADAKEHVSGNLFSAWTEHKTGKLSSEIKRKEASKTRAAKERTEGSCAAATGPETMAARSAGKKLKSVTEPADAKEHGSGNLFSAWTEQKTGKLSSAVKWKVASKTPAAMEKTEGTPSAANTQTESTPSAVAKQETEGTRSAATGPQTMTARSAGKKRKSVTEPADAKEHGSGNLFSAWTEQKTGKRSSAMKWKEASKIPSAMEKTQGMDTLSAANTQTESMPSAVAKQKTEGTRSAAKGPQTMTAHSAAKKRKSVNEPADAKEHGSWNLFSASMDQKTGNPLSAMKRKEASKTIAAKEKTEGMDTLSASNTQTESTPSAVAKQKTKGTRSAATRPETMAACSAGKKRKSVNGHADTKEHGSWNLFSASVEQKTGKPSSAVKQKTETLSTAAKEQKTGKGTSAVKKQETEHSSAAAKKQEAESASLVKKKQATENSSSKANNAEIVSVPSKLLGEKAVLVAVDSRSQRVRKPKVFAD